jgi:hypothetical protein
MLMRHYCLTVERGRWHIPLWFKAQPVEPTVLRAKRVTHQMLNHRCRIKEQGAPMGDLM